MNHESRIKNDQLKTPIVILHGWRLTGEKYETIQKIFEKNGYRVYAPTLPGSADIPLTKSAMSINDYIEVVLKLVQKYHAKKIILLGHSFGGRIAAKLTALHPEVVDKLILTGAPLIKQPLSLKAKILSTTAKIVKKGLLISFGTDRMRKVFYYLLGEWDYYKSPIQIRETFKKIIAEDISVYLAKISVPTLIVWGGQDTFVGKTLGKEITKRIPYAVYKEVASASHKLPYEKPEKFAKLVLEFIKK